MRQKSPLFYLRHLSGLLLVTALLCAVGYCYLDIPAASYFEQTDPFLRRIAKYMTNMIDPWYYYFVWPLVFFVTCLLFKNKLWSARTLLLILCIPLTSVVIGILKYLVGRSRPELLFSEGIFHCAFFKMQGLWQSFPSGHAGTAGAICGALSCCFPRARYLFLPIALVFAMTRVVLTEHYLSDIIAGVAVGLLVSEWVALLMNKAPYHFTFTRR